jgi:hypothetical protein
MDGREAGNWMPDMVPVPPEDAGTVALDLAGPVEAGSLQRFTLTYTAGRYGIDDTGSIKICFRFASDMGKPQFTDPAAANFVAVAASNGARLDVRFDPKGNTRPYDRSIHIKVLRGFMRAGDKIAVAFGTDPRGPGQQMQTFVDPDLAFRVLADPIATYTFVAVPGVPKLPIEPGAAYAWHLVLPTLRGMGDAVTLCIRADDAWGNPTWKHAGQSLALTVDGPLEGLPSVAAMPEGQIALRLEGLRAATSGTAHVSVAAVNATSNPMVVQEWPLLRAYWGDLHAQSGETIGSGTIEAYLRYGRDYAFLDAIGHQGNDFQITPQFWRHLNRRMAEWDSPGRFVTVPGYEWSGNTALGGDRNVFYQSEDRPIRRSSHALVPERDDLDIDCWDARALLDALRPEAATTVMWAHCGGRYADIRYAHDPELERSVEVHSSWGTFEWLVSDAFELGLRVGIVANSDGHKGRPGAEPPGASLFGALGGLTCYFLPELSRAALFEAMRARHHYATTGCRLHLETGVTVGGRQAMMGDIVTTQATSIRFHAAVAAASPVLSVELRCGCEVIETLRPHADAPLSKRVRVEWSGAEYRGRGRETIWDGFARAVGGTVVSAQAINFLNPQRPLRQPALDRVEWTSITTGNFAGVDLVLSDDAQGIAVQTPHATVERALDALEAEPLVVDCGGLARQLRLSRLPSALTALSVAFDRDVPLLSADNPLLVCVTLEDGHQAWSSPIYVVRGAS